MTLKQIQQLVCLSTVGKRQIRDQLKQNNTGDLKVLYGQKERKLRNDKATRKMDCDRKRRKISLNGDCMKGNLEREG